MVLECKTKLLQKQSMAFLSQQLMRPELINHDNYLFLYF